MPLNHAEVTAERRKITVPFGPLGSLEVTYNPSLMTPDFQQGLMDTPEEANGIGAARLLAAVMTEWDYLDEKKKAFPTTIESLRGIAIPILDKIVTAIFEDLRPKPKPSDNSASSF